MSLLDEKLIQFYKLQIAYAAVEQDLLRHITRGEEGIFRRRVVKLCKQKQKEIEEQKEQLLKEHNKLYE